LARSGKPIRAVNITQVVLDSSFLVSLLRGHRDPEDEIRSTIRGATKLVCLDLIIYELERLVRDGGGKTARIARVALDVAKRRTKIVEAPVGPRDVDLAIVIFALTHREKVVVASVDRNLIQICANNGVASLRPRSHSGLLASWTSL